MRYWQVLKRNPELAKMWLAQVISLMGDWFNTVVLSTLVAQYSNGSGLAISLFLMARFVPPLFVGPFTGVIVDRFNRKTVLILTNFLRALVVPLFLLANSPDMLWVIYGVTIIQFCLSALFEPAQSAIIPSLVKEEDLVDANTLLSITWSSMLAIGAVLGGVFAYFFGVQASLLADAATFLLAGALTVWVKYTPEQRQKIGEKAKREDTSFGEGVRFALKTPQMLAGLFVKFGQSFGNIDTLLTVFATQIFIMGNNGEVSLGIFYSVFGVGAFIAPLLMNWLNDGSVARMRRLVIVGFLALCLGWVLLGNAATMILACVAIFFRAIGGSLNWTYSTIIIQKTAPDNKLGRMFSLDWMGFHLATVASTLAHGSLVDLWGAERVRDIAFATGIVSLLPLGIWLCTVWYLEKREVTQPYYESLPVSVAGD